MSTYLATGKSVADWAEENGAAFTWMTPADNYEPMPREYHHGKLYRYDITRDDETRQVGVILMLDGDAAMSMAKARRASFLLDDGRTIEPMYVSGWNENGAARVFLAPFPTNYDENGAPIMRADDPSRAVNYDSWTLGPRVTYHLKIHRDA